MSEICLNLLTRLEIDGTFDPLDRIWSLEHWFNSLDRVRHVDCQQESNDYQRFELWFDAGITEPDRVQVERFRRDREIEVVHLVPPPGIKALSARWWTDVTQTGLIFARRKVLIDEASYSPALAQKMFTLLRENLQTLMRWQPCVAK